MLPTTFLRLAYSGDEPTPSHYKYKKNIPFSSGFSAGKTNTKPLKQTGVDNSILKIDPKLIFRFSNFTQSLVCRTKFGSDFNYHANLICRTKFVSVFKCYTKFGFSSKVQFGFQLSHKIFRR